MGLMDIGAAVFSAAERAAAPRAAVVPFRRGSRALAGGNATVLGQVLAKHGSGAARYFQAAQDNRFTYGMAGLAISAEAVTRQSLSKLRARSRQEAAINDYAKRFLDILESNVVGPWGFALQPRYENTDGTPDDQAAKATADAWQEWGNKETCDLAGTLSWQQMEKLILRNAAIDGEIFVRKVMDRRLGRWQFALEIIDPELVSVDDHRELPNGNVVRMGIEYNQANRPVAYWVVQPDRRTSWMMTGYSGVDAVRIPASEIVHVFEPVRPGQGRGWPWMATSLMRLALLEGLEDAALVAARVGANKVAWITQGENGVWTGDGRDTDGVDYLSGEPGSIGKLRTGETVQSWDPQYPNNELGPFASHLLRGIAGGVGAPYVSLSNDLSGVNYSSIRAGMLEARDLYRSRQVWLAACLHREVFRSWMPLQLGLGNITLPGGSALPPRKMEKFLKVYWRPRGYEWVDPLKEVQAHEIAIVRGTMTESESIRNRGQDPEAVWQERRYELARKAALGLPPGPDVPSIMAPEPANQGE